MTDDELIDGIIEREGGFVNDVKDAGGATKFGITSRVLGEFRKLGRSATVAEVKALSVAEARQIYAAQYLRPFATVPFPEIRAQLVDFAVLSGPVTAIKALQTVLGVPADGVLGDQTSRALAVMPWTIVNAALVAQRVKLFAGIVDKDASQVKWLHGWCRRAVAFLV